jgi:hypothetical protein
MKKQKLEQQQPMPDITSIVMAGSFKDKTVRAAKAGLPNGEQLEGELVVRVPFRVSKGFPGEIKPTATVLSQAVLAKALVNSGVTAKHFGKSLVKAAREALAEGHTVSQEVSATDPRVAEMLAMLDDVINQMPKTPRAASVSVQVLTESGEPEVTSLIIHEAEAATKAA